MSGAPDLRRKARRLAKNCIYSCSLDTATAIIAGALNTERERAAKIVDAAHGLGDGRHGVVEAIRRPSVHGE